jgi:hypothetical protein
MPLTSVWLANRTVPCSTTKKNGGWKSYDQLAFINYLGTRAMMLKPCGTQGIKSGTGGKTLSTGQMGRELQVEVLSPRKSGANNQVPTLVLRSSSVPLARALSHSPRKGT